MEFCIEKVSRISDLTLDSFKELGNIEGTFWGCYMTQNFNSGKYRINIIRSPSDSAVKIKVKVMSSGCGTELLSTNGNLLPKEHNQISFNLNTGRSNNWAVSVTVYHAPMSKKEEVTPNILPTTQLASDLLHLLVNPDSLSDATLVCGTSIIPVHRVILSARSPIFAAMFKTQMQEGRDGVVDIVDMEPDVLQAMLKYVYSGNTDHFTDSLAGGLLFAADKYQLEELKLICVKILKANMAANNVFRSLVLGDLHEKSLKTHAVEFICKYRNFSDLEKTEDWQCLLKERPSLALEVATSVIKYVQNK